MRRRNGDQSFRIDACQPRLSVEFAPISRALRPQVGGAIAPLQPLSHWRKSQKMSRKCVPVSSSSSIVVTVWRGNCSRQMKGFIWAVSTHVRQHNDHSFWIRVRPRCTQLQQVLQLELRSVFDSFAPPFITIEVCRFADLKVVFWHNSQPEELDFLQLDLQNSQILAIILARLEPRLRLKTSPHWADFEIWPMSWIFYIFF